MKTGSWILFTAVSVIGRYSTLTSGQSFSQDEFNLRQLLMGPGSNYSNVVRPASQVDIKIRFNLLSINGLDTRGQTMSSTGWLTVDKSTDCYQCLSAEENPKKWSDPRLVWNPALHGNIDYLFDTELVLWRPELVIDNAVDSVGVIEDDDLLIRVKATGEVTWEPPGIYSTSCDIDVRYYPFDRQRCTVEVTSWAYTVNEVNLSHLSSNIFTVDYSINGEWDLMSTEVTRKTLVETEGTYSQVDFTIILQRRVTYYVLNVLLPIILTSFLSVVTFILPFESGEKVSYALTVLLSYAVLMLLVSDAIPPTSIHVSVLGLYLALILFVGTSSTVLAVYNLYLFHMAPEAPISKASKSFVSAVLVPLTSWRKRGQEAKKIGSSSVKVVPLDHSDSKEKNNDKSETENQILEEPFYSWKEIALMSDVLCFRVYGIFVILLTVIFLITMVAGGYTT